MGWRWRQDISEWWMTFFLVGVICAAASMNVRAIQNCPRGAVGLVLWLTGK